MAYSLAVENVILGSGQGPVATLTGLGPGQYVVTAKLELEVGEGSPPDPVTCDLEVGDATDVSGVLFDNQSAGYGVDTLPLLAAAEVPAGGGAAIISCTGPSSMIVRKVKLVAILIDNLMREFQ